MIAASASGAGAMKTIGHRLKGPKASANSAAWAIASDQTVNGLLPGIVDDAADVAAQVGAREHAIDEAAILQKLRSLEARGQVLPDGLLNHAWPCESDQRPWLGEDHIAKHREARRHASGRRV